MTVIDTATDTVITVIHDPSFNFPWGVAVTPDGRKVYVTDNGNFTGNTVSVIATATNVVTATITLPANAGPIGLAVTPDGSKVYVANNTTNLDSVSVIDTATDTVVGSPIPVGTRPGQVAVTPDGRKAYVTNNHSDNVSVIATATDTVVGSPIPVVNFPGVLGVFIQPRFAGTPRHSNCYGNSVTALARTFGGLNRAAAALGYPSVRGLQTEILAYCEGSAAIGFRDHPHRSGDDRSTKLDDLGFPAGRRTGPSVP
jgi:YVTN family beta-propeller protein